MKDTALIGVEIGPVGLERIQRPGVYHALRTRALCANFRLSKTSFSKHRGRRNDAVIFRELSNLLWLVPLAQEKRVEYTPLLPVTELSTSDPAPSSRAWTRKALATVALVLLVGLAVRILFIVCTPADVYSADMSAWQVVVSVLQHGQNPYQWTKYLSWPPFWMQILFGLGRLAAILDISLFKAVRGFLLVCEGVTVVLTSLLLVRCLPSKSHRMLLTVGFALNPIAVLLVCQHCNFDVLAALWILLFLVAQVNFQAHGQASDWLLSCLSLGLGVLTKTVPLVLAPLLLVGLRKLTWKERGFGFALFVGPAALALSVLYVLAPAAVVANVLAYRSFPGWFGITGLLDVANLHAAAYWYTRAASWLFAAGLASLSIFLLRQPRLLPSELILLAALLLMAVVIFGPGYGPQYVSWYLPLLVASWAFWRGMWRVSLLVLAVVATFTYMEEYGLLQSHGSLFLRMGWTGDWLQRHKDFASPATQSLIRLPLFLAYLVLFFTGIGCLRQSLRAHSTLVPLRG